jgi:hypothetical protein
LRREGKAGRMEVWKVGELAGWKAGYLPTFQPASFDIASLNY